MSPFFQTSSIVDLIALCVPIGGLLVGLYLSSTLKIKELRSFSFVVSLIYSFVATLYYFELRNAMFDANGDLLKLSLDMSGGFILFVIFINVVIGPFTDRAISYFGRQRAMVQRDKIRRQAYSKVTFLQIFYYVQIVAIFGLFMTVAIWIIENDAVSSFVFGGPDAIDCTKPEIIEIYHGALPQFSNDCMLRFSKFSDRVGSFVLQIDLSQAGIISDIFSAIMAFLTLLLMIFPELIAKIRKQTNNNSKYVPDPIDNIDDMDVRRMKDDDSLTWPTNNPDDGWRETKGK